MVLRHWSSSPFEVFSLSLRRFHCQNIVQQKASYKLSRVLLENSSRMIWINGYKSWGSEFKIWKKDSVCMCSVHPTKLQALLQQTWAQAVDGVENVIWLCKQRQYNHQRCFPLTLFNSANWGGVIHHELQRLLCVLVIQDELQRLVKEYRTFVPPFTNGILQNYKEDSIVAKKNFGTFLTAFYPYLFDN
ncbi:uncharacterized protein LOC113298123 [Papaver somniferum]|uniref:uncharacterized protein LOC113298123 n=1 Tax=Papaver somniferum TaxID=3469 RepID=UPI000E6F6540|nr:uncharacterized protein LOC113298123 [Papaver somniferum]